MMLPPVEPSSDSRSYALMVRGLFVAYMNVGFNEEQAMDLVKTQMAIAAHIQHDHDDED